MAQNDRDILFSNEAFVIGMLQAVSGSALVVGLAQSEALNELGNNIAFLLFLTAMASALLLAVLAAYWKHQYKLWDVKAQASASKNEMADVESRSYKASQYLKAMRIALFMALLSILLGITQLIVAFWLKALCTG